MRTPFGEDDDADEQQNHDLEYVQDDGGPHADLEPDDHRQHDQDPVGDGDDRGDSPDVGAAQHVVDDVATDEDVDPTERDDVSEQRNHADGGGNLRSDRPGDVSQKGAGAGVDAGKQRQA